MACKRLRDDCRHDSLPQERTAVVRIRPSPSYRMLFLRRRLIRMAAAALPDGRSKFSRFSRLRIIDPHPPDSYTTRDWQRSAGVLIPEVTALDWSAPEGAPAPTEPSRRRPFSRASGGRRLFASDEQRDLAGMLPNLREVDFSHARPAGGLSLDDPAARRDHLEDVAWRINADRPEGRFTLRGCRALRVVRADGACFEGRGDRRDARDVYLLDEVRDRLERVSVRGACWSVPCLPASLLCQEVLIRFVRDAPNLRWFRSDLTPENVAMLKAERPDVTFVS
jgi:hypothetical protein